MWHLNGRFASQTAMKLTQGFLCFFMTEKPGYNLKLLDIEPGKTKTLLKENNVNHVFFLKLVV